MLSKPGRWTVPALALLAAGSLTSDAFGQGNTFNPYGNSGYRDYREFTQPMYSNEPSLPGQARLQGGGIGGGTSRANQFDAFSESLDGRDSDASGSSLRSRPGVPYYKSFRQYDEKYGRVYTPNASADKEFGDRMKKRSADYDRAIAEKDPAVRARLLRQLDQDTLDRPKPPIARGAAAAAKGAAPKGATAKATRPAAAGTAAPRIPATAADATSAFPGARTPASATAATPRVTRPAAPAPAPAASQPPATSSAGSDPGSVPIPPPR